MIRVRKPPKAPERLSRGTTLVDTYEKELAAGTGVGTSSKNPFKFDKAIYGHAEVKTALKEAQHDKCCYCESHISHIAAGHVEHYRPKTCSQQAKGQPLLYPGYYWLAYAWSNLYFVCERCNSSGKKNLFPLRIPARRNRKRTDRRKEEPLILDPGGAIDPRDHIVFKDAAIEATSAVGQSTIDVLGLDRIPLTTARLRYLKLCITIRALAEAPGAKLDPHRQEEQRRAREFLQRRAAPEAEYSAMITDLLARR